MVTNWLLGTHPYRIRYALLAMALAFSFFWNLGGAPLFDEDEGFFAEGTREMALNNDFVSTYVNREARFDKPPLTNWLQYGSAKIFGWNEFALRLPSALAALLWVSLIFFFVRRKSGVAAAYYATLMATCSLQITIIGKAAIADSLLNACLTGAMFCLYELLNGGKQRFVYLFYLLTGIGFLCKGPIAILVPGAVGILYILRWRKWRKLFTILNPVGLLLFLMVTLPWYWMQYEQMGDRFIQGFFFNHNVNRFMTAFEGHYGGILYFIPVLILGIMPFTGWFFSTFSKLRYLWHDRWFSFMLFWFAFVFIFFSLSGTKLHHYIVYGYSALFTMTGWFANYSTKRYSALPLVSLLILFLIFPLLLSRIVSMVDDAYATEVLKGAEEAFNSTFLLQVAGLLIVVMVTLIFKKWPKELHMWITGMTLLTLVNGIVMPRVGALLQEPVKEAAVFARTKNYQNLVVLDHYMPSFHFYSGLFAEERKPRAGDVVLARITNLRDYPNREILFDKHGIELAKIK